MKTLLKSIIFLGTLLTISACQTIPYQGQAREVKKKPNEGGVIAVSLDYRKEDRDVAELKMRQTCGNAPFKITEEGEVVIGQKTSSNSQETNRDRTQMQVGNLFGVPVMSGDAGGKNSYVESTVNQVKEWQINYICEIKTAEPITSTPKAKSKKM